MRITRYKLIGLYIRNEHDLVSFNVVGYVLASVARKSETKCCPRRSAVSGFKCVHLHNGRMAAQ